MSREENDVNGEQAGAPVCQCCPRALYAARGRLVCVECERRIAGQLIEVARLWEKLKDDDMLEQGAGAPREPDRVQVSGPIETQAPGNLDALSLRAGGVVGRLIVHEDAWRRDLRWTATPWRGNQDQTLKGVLLFLRNNLPWACGAYDDVDDLSRDLYRLVRDMTAAVTGDRRPAKALAAPCPLPARDQEPDDDGELPACGGTLTYYPQELHIRCGDCRRTVGITRWAELGIAAGVITEAA